MSKTRTPNADRLIESRAGSLNESSNRSFVISAIKDIEKAMRDQDMDRLAVHILSRAIDTLNTVLKDRNF